MKSQTHLCPVCGFSGLKENPRSREGGGSYEICPCCDFEFGVTDDDKGIDYNTHREQWIAQGMQWSSKTRKAPKNWEPGSQLANLALRATLSRVKGRPPRVLLEAAVA